MATIVTSATAFAIKNGTRKPSDFYMQEELMLSLDSKNLNIFKSQNSVKFKFNFSAITGVRFAKEQGVIYLQIQSGQLNVDGYIIEDSVYWSDSPADLKTNVHTLDFENRKLLLNELKFKNSILTGKTQIFDEFLKFIEKF